MEEKTFKKKMYANEYAAYSGYPLITVKNWCKDGTIPCDQLGRRYLIDVKETDMVLAKNRNKKMLDKEKIGPRMNKPTVRKHCKNFDYLAELKTLQKAR